MAPLAWHGRIAAKRTRAHRGVQRRGARWQRHRAARDMISGEKRRQRRHVTAHRSGGGMAKWWQWQQRISLTSA